MGVPARKSGAVTREKLLASARQQFLQESYENVGLRDIAADVGVDVALIGRYFGSKEQLFTEVLRGGKADWLEPLAKAEDLAEGLTGLASKKQRSDSNEHVEGLLIVLRSVSSPTAAPLVRAAFRDDVLEPLAKLLTGSDRDLRAGIAMGVIMGTTIVRSIMNVEALQCCEAGLFESKLAHILRCAIESPENC